MANRWQLLERPAEFDSVRSTLTGGTGGGVVLTGAAGVGKSERSCNKLLEEPAASPQWRDGGLARNHARRTVRGVDIRHVLHRVGGVER
jgi:hypothetical protein